MIYTFEILSIMIMELLTHNETLSIGKISELTKCAESIIIIALGVLLREDKIRLFEQDEDLYVELKMNKQIIINH